MAVLTVVVNARNTPNAKYRTIFFCSMGDDLTMLADPFRPDRPDPTINKDAAPKVKRKKGLTRLWMGRTLPQNASTERIHTKRIHTMAIHIKPVHIDPVHRNPVHKTMIQQAYQWHPRFYPVGCRPSFRPYPALESQVEKI
jgi:hypothetical protein